MAFGCSYDLLLDPEHPTAQGCMAALATCLDAGVGSCNADPKACHEHQVSCIEWAESSCWAKLD